MFVHYSTKIRNRQIENQMENFTKSILTAGRKGVILVKEKLRLAVENE